MIFENCFRIFLLGTHLTKGNENIQLLPEEIRHKIWLEYAEMTLSVDMLAEKEMIGTLDVVLKKRLSEKKDPKFQQTLVTTCFQKACQSAKLATMEYLYLNFFEDIYPEEIFTRGFWFTLLGNKDVDRFGVIKWMDKHGIGAGNDLYLYAITLKPRLDVVVWLSETYPELKPDGTTTASIVGKKTFGEEEEQIAKFLFLTFPEIRANVHMEHLFVLVSRCDNRRGFEFITNFFVIERQKIVDWKFVVRIMCCHGSFTCLIWFSENLSLLGLNAGAVFDDVCLNNALAYGHLKIINWLYFNIPELVPFITKHKKMNGYLLSP